MASDDAAPSDRTASHYPAYSPRELQSPTQQPTSSADGPQPQPQQRPRRPRPGRAQRQRNRAQRETSASVERGWEVVGDDRVPPLVAQFLREYNNNPQQACNDFDVLHSLMENLRRDRVAIAATASTSSHIQVVATTQTQQQPGTNTEAHAAAAATSHAPTVATAPGQQQPGTEAHAAAAATTHAPMVATAPEQQQPGTNTEAHAAAAATPQATTGSRGPNVQPPQLSNAWLEQRLASEVVAGHTDVGRALSGRPVFRSTYIPSQDLYGCGWVGNITDMRVDADMCTIRPVRRQDSALTVAGCIGGRIVHVDAAKCRAQVTRLT